MPVGRERAVVHGVAGPAERLVGEPLGQLEQRQPGREVGDRRDRPEPLLGPGPRASIEPQQGPDHDKAAERRRPGLEEAAPADIDIDHVPVLRGNGRRGDRFHVMTPTFSCRPPPVG